MRTAAQGRRLQVALVGTLDAESSDRFLEELQSVIPVAGIDQVVLDLSGLKFCDSPGLSAILRARHRLLDQCPQPLMVCRPAPAVARLLEISRLDELLLVADPDA